MRSAFNHMLTRARVLYLGGLLLSGGLKLLAALLTLFLGCVLLDALFAFGERTRLLIGMALLLGAAAGMGYGGITILTLSRRAIARWVDNLLASRRRPVLSAMELADAPPTRDATAFSQYLIHTALEQGRTAGESLSAWKLLPLARLKRDGLRFLAVLLVWSALLAIWNQPVRTHARRLLTPTLDIPPWSRLTFTVTPTHPTVIYGDSIELGVTVDGPVDGQAILFEIRDNGHTVRSAGFREAANRFVHRLERVVQPLQFCVRAGRARSRWHDLSVLYQPRIASARVTLTPPEYTGLPSREFYLGGQKLTGLRGSHITLNLTANRLIQRGFIVFTHPDGTETLLDGQASGNHSIRYAWKIENQATARIQIQDPLGTPNARTFTFSQKVLPDEPPDVSILQPPRYSLATPGSLIEVEASAEDSLGLRSVALVRNLVGYRDRILPVGIAAGAREAQMTYPLDLRMIGAQAGSTIELYAEAADTNPDLLGASMSDISRIDIISHDEYAEILRMRTAVTEFGERYTLISDQLDQLREALQELAGMEEAESASLKQRQDAAEKALKAWDQLDESYQQIAEDFAIYDMEKQLPDVLEKIRALSEPHATRLSALTDPLSDAAELAAAWLDDIGDSAAELKQQAEDAKLVDQLMEVARAAMQLQQIIDRQALLVRKLSRYEANLRTAPASLLADLAEEQAEVATLLENWFTDTTTLAEALPEDQAKLADEMCEVVEVIRENKALKYMGKATEAARNENATETYRFLREALEALRNSNSRCEKDGNSFAGMCRNPGKGFRTKPSLCSTMSQLCQSLIRQFGKGNGMGWGGAGAAGGDPANGYWTHGSSMLDVPLHGPSRSQMQALTGRGRGQGSSGKSRAGGRVKATEQMTTHSTETTETHAVTLDEIPERYREPARIFYSIDTIPEGPNPHD